MPRPLFAQFLFAQLLNAASLICFTLDKLVRNSTSVIIAHRLATVRDADRIIGLKTGQVAESGTHDKLSNRTAGVYSMLSELQFAS
ncbi:MAG: hypothetical protein O3C21_03045 [Verrucomicrobia bacterium]|nr:hypothetical protein [Verrucomicrobiota bacterium]